MAHTFHVVGNIRVRNQATIGGNLSAADYAADPPAMLTALHARVQLQGPEEKREIPLSEFFLGFYTTALAPNEILTEVIIPAFESAIRRAMDAEPGLAVTLPHPVDDAVIRGVSSYLEGGYE